MDNSVLQTINGTLEKIIYKNPDNDYFIGRLRCEDDGELITTVGYAIEIQPGEALSLKGKWVNNKKYGRQFEVKEINIKIPKTIKGIERYLGSGLIKGIGPVIAKRIVKKFKLDTLGILNSKPDRLLEIEGLAKKRVKLIKSEWEKQKNIREIMIFMQAYGISNSSAMKIYNKYRSDAVNLLKSNPYRMIEDITGIGFKTADKIASNIGIEKESIFRIRSGVIYLLKEMTESGNCYYPLDEFIQICNELLGVGQSSIINAINELEKDKKIVVKKNSLNKIWLREIYDDEIITSKKLIDLRDHKTDLKENKKTGFFRNDGLIDNKIKEIASENKIELGKTQLEAIRKSLKEKIFIITGSPGTGKSTILRVIIRLFLSLGFSIKSGAPTGRAAKRLTEATGYEATTIHRMLKYQPKINRFIKNENDRLMSDLIIIDEASMLDIRLFKSLLQAIDLESRLILVGDIDQLPAVGPGNVLSDIIESKSFPFVRLEHIYRQGGNSQIIFNAHRIRDGIYPSLKKSKYNDFYYIERNEPEATVKLIINLITNRIPDSFKFDPVKDIQVIVPTNKGIVGVNNLNTKIQERINKKKAYFLGSSTGFKINDKVIQLKNNYDKEVYNGDIGRIKDIDLEMKEIIVDFDGRVVNYDFLDIDQLNLSYAISIHKAQGSEFRCVIIPILTSHYMLLQRNLLYTAITRAKEVAVLIGSKKAIGIAVNRSMVKNRYTYLKELISIV